MKDKVALGAALLGAAALGATLVAFGNAQQDKDAGPKGGVFAASEEEEIRALVREYLIENPEVIIESLQGYDRRQREQAEARAKDAARENLAAVLDDKGGYTTGAAPEKAKVAVIELFDYHCSYCKRATGLVQQLASEDPAVKVVFREFPILREESEYAAKIALAAREQGKYPEMHFAMMNASGVLDEARVRKIADDLGLDFAKLQKAAQASEIEQAIAETDRIARELGVQGTPAFIVASVDGSVIEMVPGFSEADVRDAIAKAKKGAKR